MVVVDGSQESGITRTCSRRAGTTPGTRPHGRLGGRFGESPAIRARSAKGESDCESGSDRQVIGPDSSFPDGVDPPRNASAKKAGEWWMKSRHPDKPAVRRPRYPPRALEMKRVGMRRAFTCISSPTPPARPSTAWRAPAWSSSRIPSRSSIPGRWSARPARWRRSSPASSRIPGLVLFTIVNEELRVRWDGCRTPAGALHRRCSIR